MINSAEQSETIDEVDVFEEVNLGALEEMIELDCQHEEFHSGVELKGIEDQQYCCLYDTGAQVSLMSERVYGELVERGSEAQLEGCRSILVGVGRNREEILGVVRVTLVLNGQECDNMPFAVVRESSLPCCLLLGANFLSRNHISLDFQSNMITMNSLDSEERFFVNLGLSTEFDGKSRIVEYFGSVDVDEIVSDTEYIPKYIISTEELLLMQNRDVSLRKIKNMKVRGVTPDFGRDRSLREFQRCFKHLGVSIIFLCFFFY